MRFVTRRSAYLPARSVRQESRYTSIATSPPGLRQGSKARNDASGSGVCWRTPKQKRRSATPGRSGRARRSAWRNVTFGSGLLRRAASTASDASREITVAPVLAASPVNRPAPQPASTTTSPGRERGQRVSRPKRSAVAAASPSCVCSNRRHWKPNDSV